jgi:hypothetical protein
VDTRKRNVVFMLPKDRHDVLISPPKVQIYISNGPGRTSF